MVEGARLESVYTLTRIEGSNPSLSANNKRGYPYGWPFFIISRDLNPDKKIRQIRQERIWTTEGRPEGVAHKEVRYQSLSLRHQV